MAGGCFHSEAEGAYTEVFGHELIPQKVQEDLHKRGNRKARYVYSFKHLMFWGGSTIIGSFDSTTLSRLHLTLTTGFQKSISVFMK